MSCAIADVPVRTESVPSSEFGTTTDIHQTLGNGYVIGTVLLSSANNRHIRFLNDNREQVADIYIGKFDARLQQTGLLTNIIFLDQIRDRLRFHLLHNPGAVDFNRPVAKT